MLCPYHLFEETMSDLKKEHPKARHFIYAYRYLNEFEQIVENQSDDGEPKGSSGPPALAVLRGENLINSAAIIVRYFGGIKLGVGGLVRAYGKSVHLALEKAQVESFLRPYIKYCEKQYKVSIKNLGKIEYYLKNDQNIIVRKKFLGPEVTLVVQATKPWHIDFEQFLNQ